MTTSLPGRALDSADAVTFAALQMRQDRLRLLQERIDLLTDRGIATAHLLGLVAEHQAQKAAFEADLKESEADGVTCQKADGHLTFDMRGSRRHGA